MRRTVATEFLQNTHLLIDQVAERVGFSDATSKAFRKWTGIHLRTTVVQARTLRCHITFMCGESISLVRLDVLAI